MVGEPQDALRQRLDRLALASAGVAAVIVLIAMAGWALHLPRLTDVMPGLATMKVNTSIGLLACAIAVLLRLPPFRSRLAGRIADTLATLALVIGALSLLEYLTARDLGIDRLIYHDTAMPPHGHPGRMSIATASGIFLLGGSALLLDRASLWSRAMLCGAIAIAALGLFGYTISVQGLYDTGPFSSMAINTAMAMGLIGSAQFIARPRRSLDYLFRRPSVGALLVRRLIPPVVAVPIIFGYLRLKAQQAGYVNQGFGVAMMALISIVVLGVLIWWNASLLDQSDAARRRVEEDRDQLLGREQTARLRAEKALLARDQLLAIVSHELRTPLTPALLTATALEMDPTLPPELRDDLRLIQGQIQIEAQLIDDLLDMASINQGKLVLRPREMDLHTLIRGLETTFSKQPHDPHVRLQIDLDSQSPGLTADPLRLRQVLSNLINNAIKFSPGGGTVRVRTYDLPDDCLAVEVSDGGVGIEPEALGRIFNTFEQGDPSTTRRFGGLGVGLTISKALVELHRGTLTAASDGPGKGAVFQLRLPRHPPAATPIASRAGKPLILLVDDNAQTLTALERLLQSRGYRTATATTAATAIAAASRQRFDLLVSDIGLPDLSGWELLRELRQRGPLPGIAVSGFLDDGDRAKSLACGYAAHLAKPLDFQHLLAAIESALAPGTVGSD
jgi:signal transduction histidine kinase